MDPFEVFDYWDSRRTSPTWHWQHQHTQNCNIPISSKVGSMAQWLERWSLAGRLSLIYAWSMD